MEEVIRFENVKKSFGKRVLFEDVNIHIEKNACVALVGQNGSGKSVFYKILIGFEKVDKGNVYVREKKVGGKDGFPEDVGVIINAPVYLENRSGLENLLFLANIRKKVDEEHIRNVMRKVGLSPEDTTKVKNYSMGMRKKIGIAQAIMEEQDIIILDEPFSELDYKAKEDIIGIIKNLKEEGKTILLTSHDKNDINRLCDKIFLLKDKKIQLVTKEEEAEK